MLRINQGINIPEEEEEFLLGVRVLGAFFPNDS